jgi:hypothetical protein
MGTPLDKIIQLSHILTVILEPPGLYNRVVP